MESSNLFNFEKLNNPKLILMKTRLSLMLMLIFSISTFSQIPSYYNDVNLNLSGSDLKDELAVKIISSHANFLSYTPGVWDALKQTDLDPTDSSKVLLIYGWNDSDSDITNDRTRGRDQNGGGSGVWNREHVYSKSLADPNLGTTGPGADAHNLRPCDAQRNSSRSNRKFADGTGNSGITAQGYWYPGDEWKGDVARMMMYMYLRYDSQSPPTGVAIGVTNAIDPNMINILLEWNAEDPVSALELQRNPVLEQLQGNRNPFIDNPAFATQIWGGPQAEDFFGTGNNGNNDTQAPSVPNGLVSSNITQNTADLTWSASTDDTAVAGYQILSGTTVVGNTPSTNFTVTNLMSGTSYSFIVKAYDAANNISAASNSVSITTLNGGSGNGTATELLISEYVEGSSNNKAIEIANFTGTSINLSGYSLQKSTNGGGTFGSTFNLTGTLANGEVYIVANSSATLAILNVSDATSGVATFNGNDAVGLFKNGTLIDLIGNPNSADVFAANTTLRRKSSIKSPNTSYTIAEWDTFASDTFDDLDTHTIDGGNTTDTTAPSVPANLVASNISQSSVNLSWLASTDDTAVTGYDVYQNDIKIATITNTSYTVTGLDPDTAYNYAITAFDAATNTSSQSIKVFITTLPPPDTQAPIAPTSLVASNIAQTTLDLTWIASTDNIGVSSYDVYQNGALIGATSTTNYAVTNLIEATVYDFYVIAKDDAGNTSTESNTVNVTTESAAPTGTASDLLISEYVEGSSNNKAIEIANFTGATVDLSAYSLRKATNGSGSFSSSMTLSGSLTNGQVYVVANSSASAAILNIADITNGSVLTFNGNDAVGLFKNNILIDLIGNASSASVYAQDVTLRRKTSVNNPNTTYTVEEWDSFAQDTFDGLDSHTLDGATDTTAPKAPSSLTALNVTQTSIDLAWTAATDNIGVSSYDVSQDGTVIATISATNYVVNDLTANTSYSFSITAKDEADNVSAASNIINVTTQAIPSGPTTTELSAHYFENGFDGWIDGGVDCARYSGSRSYEGNHSIRLRDNSGVASSMTSSSYNLTFYDFVEVSFHFYVYSMENGEDFWLRYYDGNSWQTIETWTRGIDIENNNFYESTIILDASTYNFVNNAQFRFQNDASGNADHIYIDQVIISGIENGGTSAKSSTVKRSSTVFTKSLNTDEFNNFEEDFRIYPNPVSSNLNVQLVSKDAKNVSYRIVSLLGQVITTGNLTNNSIKVNTLKPGIYVLEINDGEDIMTRKFVKR